MIWAIISIIGGLATLVVGGECLVRGASRIAAVVGISPLVIGLTVVAFGTSSPELAGELAIGEVGLIVSSHAFVSPEGQAGPWQLGIYDDGLISGLTRSPKGWSMTKLQISSRWVAP